MKELKKLLAERKKLAARLPEIDRTEAQAKADGEKVLNGASLDDLSERDAAIYSTLNLKLKLCAPARKKIEAQIEELDRAIVQQYLSEHAQAEAQARADQTALMNRMIEALLPIIGNERDATGIAKGELTLRDSRAWRKTLICVAAIPRAVIIELQTGQDSWNGTPIHELAERLIAAETAMRTT